MIALSPKQTQNYIAICDRNLPEAEQVVFVIKSLTPAEEASLDDEVGTLRDGTYQVRAGHQNLVALHYGLENVLNFKDEDGKVIPFFRNDLDRMENGTSRIADDFLGRISKDIRDEVATVIKANRTLSEDERKNSQPSL